MNPVALTDRALVSVAYDERVAVETRATMAREFIARYPCGVSRPKVWARDMCAQCARILWSVDAEAVKEGMLSFADFRAKWPVARTPQLGRGTLDWANPPVVRNWAMANRQNPLLLLRIEAQRLLARWFGPTDIPFYESRPPYTEQEFRAAMEEAKAFYVAHEYLLKE